MIINIEQVKLLAVRAGTYTVYVFQNEETKKFIMCTRLPNWQVPDVAVGDSGYLEYQSVQSGDKYFSATEQVDKYYLYSNVYFLNFIQKADILKNNEIIL